MKNIIFAATAMIVAMTAVSCSKVAGIEENPSYTYRFAVVNEELPSVKSNMSDDHLVFETGDYLGFSLEKDGQIAETQRTSIQTTEPRPIFGFTTNHQMKAGDRICVVSPRVLPINNGKFNDRREPVNADPMQSITIPLVQTHKGGKFDGAAMPMVSVPFTFTKDMLVGADNQLQEVKFLNLGALLDFRVFSATYQGEIVRDVIFEADKKNIVGEFKINVQNVNPDDEKTLAIDLTSARAEGEFAAPLTNVARTESDAKVDADKDHSGSVRMVVAPGTYTGKVKVRTDKAYYVFNLSTARTFDRNGIYPLGLNLAKATRVVMETVDRANWMVKFVNSYYSRMDWRPEKMYDGDLSTEWSNPWDSPLVGAGEDDYNYQWSNINWSVLIGEDRHRDIPNIVFVFDFKKDIEIGRVGIGKSPRDWPYNHDLRNCEFYVGTVWNFKSAREKGNLENYNTANDDNDWKLVLTATEIPKENGIFWYDVPETVSKADRTGRYLKIRPTGGYRGNTPCQIAEIYVDGIVQGNTANVE